MEENFEKTGPGCTKKEERLRKKYKNVKKDIKTAEKIENFLRTG